MLEITGALTAARALADLAKAAIEARDDAKAKTAIADLQAKLFDATSAALAMAEKAAALQTALSSAEREKSDAQAKLNERAMYTLHELVPGAFVYASEPSGQGAEPSQHYLCQACYDKGVKAILRYHPESTGRNASWRCPEKSEHTIVHHGTGKPMPPRRPNTGIW